MKEKPKIQSLISLKIVQRKVANFRLGIQHSINSVKFEGKQTNNTKPLVQNNHDVNKSKGDDFKAIKMKKSRSIKLSDNDIGVGSPSKLHELPRKLGKQTPLKTPSPQKASQCSPNYMKSTRSYEARRESTRAKVISSSSISSSSKVAKILTRSSSFKKARTLKKVPSLKLKQNTKTCSSTQKDAKFPPYLELKPGATEAKGKSVRRICKYNYCSLNDDLHNSARTPLKRFMASRRRLLKTEMVSSPEVISPRKGKLSECKERGAEDQNKEFFVNIYVPDGGVDQPVSESLSDGPRSEIDSHDDHNQSQDTESPDLSFRPKAEDYKPSSVQSDFEVQSSFSVSLDELFSESSDLIWEEGQVLATDNINDSGDIHIQNDGSDKHGKPGSETDNIVDRYLDEFPPYFHDEIVEYLCFSDAASVPDSDSTQTTQTGEIDVGEPLMVEEKVVMDSGSNGEVIKEDSTAEGEATVHATKVEEKVVMDSGSNDEVVKEDSTAEGEATVHPTKVEEESTDEHGEILSELIKEIAEAHNKDISNESDLDNYEIGEIKKEKSADIPRKIENVETSCAKDEICLANINDRDGTNQSEEENDSQEDEPESIEKNGVEVKTTVRKFNSGESDSDQELLDSCNKLKKWMRSGKEAEGVAEDREFNPRGPNFLELEPDPEAEKVDLRHQEMDERKNAEEWMLDHVLQKTVNQLTPARKKKVALLVEAYETVLPV